MGSIKNIKEKASDIYNISNAIYKKEIKLAEGKKLANKKNGMKESSFPDYYYSLKKMMNGELHQRTIQPEIRDYMLFYIRQDYGMKSLEIALDAFMQHIVYYEKIRNTKVWKNRALYEKYKNELDAEYRNELDEKYKNELELFNIQEQEELSLIVQSDDRDRIIKELKELKANDPQQITIHSKIYLRDNKTIVQLKKLRNFTCQICGARIPKADGSFYIEAAHITPKKYKGPELPNNLLILCPNHHKEFDFGNFHIEERNDDHIRFILNEIKYDISLKLE